MAQIRCLLASCSHSSQRGYVHRGNEKHPLTELGGLLTERDLLRALQNDGHAGLVNAVRGRTQFGHSIKGQAWNRCRTNLVQAYLPGDFFDKPPQCLGAFVELSGFARGRGMHVPEIELREGTARHHMRPC